MVSNIRLIYSVKMRILGAFAFYLYMFFNYCGMG